MYCGHEARSQEHIVATRFIEVLREDARQITLPVRLTLTLPSTGQRYRIGGRRTKRGHYTLEYTTRVCAQCNSEWMNDMDDAAFPYVADMIRGNPVLLHQNARAAIAGWICKVALTARSMPLHRMPIERGWTDWLYWQHSAIPTWYVWVGRYVGMEPLWYQPHDIRIELGPGSAPAPPGMDFLRENGVVATMVIGYLIAQVYGVGGTGRLATPEDEVRTLPLIWPNAHDVAWPPPDHVDDAGLQLWADRLIYQP